MSIKMIELPTKRQVLAVIAITSLVSSLVTVFALAHFPIGYVPSEVDVSGSVDQWQVFSFGGVIVTVLSLVAAFFMLVFAIDAFAVSKEVNQNAEKIESNLKLVDKFQQRVERADREVNELRAKTDELRFYFELVEVFLEEVNEASDASEKVLSFLEIVHDLLELDDESKETLLEGKKSFRLRRMRYDAIVALLTDNLNEEKKTRLGSAVVELTANAAAGDERSLELLRQLEVKGLYNHN